MQQKRRIKVCQSLDLESPETSYSDIQLMLLHIGQYLYLHSDVYCASVDLGHLYVSDAELSMGPFLSLIHI